MTLRQISQQLQQDFSISAETAEQSVRQLTSELVQQQLVETIDLKEFPGLSGSGT